MFHGINRRDIKKISFRMDTKKKSTMYSVKTFFNNSFVIDENHDILAMCTKNKIALLICKALNNDNKKPCLQEQCINFPNGCSQCCYLERPSLSEQK